MGPVFGEPVGPVALCTRFVSVFRHTTDCPRQVVTFTGVTAAAELQFTVIGDELTVSCAEPVTLPTVALIATGPPGVAPRARPFPSTVAAVPVLLQVGAGAPVTAIPRAGLATWLEAARATTWAEPFATAVTTPVELTVATAGASVVQPNDAPATGLPPPSNAVATSWTVSPRLASEADVPPACVFTDTLVTTWATATDDDPLTPFQDALTAELPFPSAVTSPAAETPATPGELLDHVKVTLAVTSPSRGLVAVAESCAVWPRLEKGVTLGGLIVTVSAYTAVESTVISPPPADETVPTVATALTITPSEAPAETVARPSVTPSVTMVASAASVVVHAGGGAPTTGWLRASSAAAWKSGVSF